MGQVVFELDLKPKPMRAMIVPIGEDAAHVRCEGHKSEQMFLKEGLALIRPAMGKNSTRGGFAVSSSPRTFPGNRTRKKRP